MNKNAKMIFAIAIAGTLACFLSFFISIVRGNFISGIAFGLAGAFCLSTAVGIFRHK